MKLVFLLLLPIALFSQSYQVKYEYKIPSGDILSYDLITNGNYSKFTNIKFDKSKEENAFVYAPTKAFFVLKNIKKNLLISTEFLGKNRVIIKDSLNIMNWELLEETKEILGMQCFKAKMNFRGRDYEAFYTPDIKIHDGPWKFQGLPGLILEIYSSDGDYHYQATELSKIPDFKELEQDFTKEKLYDWESFKVVYVAYIDNLIKYFKSEGEETGHLNYYKIDKPEIIYEKAQFGQGIEY